MIFSVIEHLVLRNATVLTPPSIYHVPSTYALLNPVECWDLTLVFLIFSRTYGKLRAWLETRGKAIGALDMLITAHALSKGLPLATNNVTFSKALPQTQCTRSQTFILFPFVPFSLSFEPQHILSNRES